MGILNRTPDSFYDHGATFELDRVPAPSRGAGRPGRRHSRRGRREGRPRPRGRRSRRARPGRRPDRSAARALRRRDLVRHVAGVGARRRVRRRRGRRQRHQRVRRSATTSPSPPPTARPWWPRTSASQPRVPDPEPHYDDLLGDVTAFLLDRADAAEAAGLAPEQIALDAGLDLGKSPGAERSAAARERRPRVARLHAPALGVEQALPRRAARARHRRARRAVSLASVAYGVAHGCRIVRVHDVAGSVEVCRMVEAMLDASRENVR